MSMERRVFPGLLTSAAAKAQSTGKPVNLDEHGDMKLSGVDAASQHVMAAMNAPAAAPAAPLQPVFTRSGGNLRHGVYGNETRLTPAVVRGGLHKLFSLAMPGDKRGTEAQPLFAPGVRTTNGQTHDLCICCTMANQVWAFRCEQRAARLEGISREADQWLRRHRWAFDPPSMGI
jgi:hypothetical protein